MAQLPQHTNSAQTDSAYYAGPQPYTRTAVVLGIAALIVGFIVVLSQARSADKPSINQASTDVASLTPLPAYDAGFYSSEDQLWLESVDFIEVERHTNTCTATGELSFTNGEVRAEARVLLTYVRANNGGWQAEGPSQLQHVSWIPLAGVDGERVLAHTTTFLQRADASASSNDATDTVTQDTTENTVETTAADATNTENEAEASASDAQNTSSTEAGSNAEEQNQSLATLYRSATRTIADEHFDATLMTDTVVVRLSCSRAYATYTCDLTLVFLFDTSTGTWKLDSATADSDAFKPHYTSNHPSYSHSAHADINNTSTV